MPFFQYVYRRNAFNPLSLAPTAFYRAPNYTATPSGVFTASAGSNLTESGSPAPAALSGAPNFNIATDYTLQGTDVFTTWSSTSQRYLWAKVITSLTSWGTTTGATRYTNPSPIHDHQQFTGLHFWRTGSGPYQFFISMYDWPGAANYVDIEVTSLVDAGTGVGTIIAEGRKTAGGDLQVRAGNLSTRLSWVNAGLTLGVTTGGGFCEMGPWQGVVRAAFAKNTTLNDASSDQLYTWGLTNP